jgi:hypothetical protein
LFKFRIKVLRIKRKPNSPPSWVIDPYIKDRGLVVATAVRSDAALVRVLIECVFVRVVTELKTCHIYETILWTIKVAARNLSWSSNYIT